jgi:hypothetical protein
MNTTLATSGEPESPPKDIFDDLGALKLEPNANALVGAVEVLAIVPVRRPGPTEWVRVHPDSVMTLATSLYIDAANRETYLVLPAVREAIITGLKVLLLVTAVTSRGSLFLWPLSLPDETGRSNRWHESAREAATMAKSVWVKMAADMAAGYYKIFQAEGKIPEPTWPNRSFNELLRIAFRDRTVDSIDHPIVRESRGRNP